MGVVHYEEVYILFFPFLRFSRDRFRTTVNVFGDAIGAGIVAHLSRDDLPTEDPEEYWPLRYELKVLGQEDEPRPADQIISAV